MDKISVAAALLAAGLWLWSALVQIPLLSVGWGGVTIADHPFYRAMRKTARLNAAAAICAFVSALAQAYAFNSH